MRNQGTSAPLDWPELPAASWQFVRAFHHPSQLQVTLCWVARPGAASTRKGCQESPGQHTIRYSPLALGVGVDNAAGLTVTGVVPDQAATSGICTIANDVWIG